MAVQVSTIPFEDSREVSLIPVEDQEVNLVPVEEPLSGGPLTKAVQKLTPAATGGSTLSIATPRQQEEAKRIREMITGKDVVRPRSTATQEIRAAKPKNLFERGIDAVRHAVSPYETTEAMDPGEIASAQISLEAQQHMTPERTFAINGQPVTLQPRPMTRDEYIEHVVPEGEGVRTAERFLGGIPEGVKGVASGALGAAQALGSDTAGQAADAMQADELNAPRDESLSGELGAGLGSMLTFLIPSMGVSKAMSLVAEVAPKAASLAGAGSMAAFEGATEAGSVFREMKQQGYTDHDASVAATKTFLANLPLNFLTDKAAFFPEGSADSMVKRGINAMTSEGVQEGTQEYISERSQPDKAVDMGAIAENALVGGLTGGLTGAALHRAESGAHEIRSNADAVTDPRAVSLVPVDEVQPAGQESRPVLDSGGFIRKSAIPSDPDIHQAVTGAASGLEGQSPSVTSEEAPTSKMEATAAVDHEEPPTAAVAFLKPAQREFIRDKVASLGSMTAVEERYPTDSPIDQYARLAAGEIFGNSMKTTEPGAGSVEQVQAAKGRRGGEDVFDLLLTPSQQGSLEEIRREIADSEAGGKVYNYETQGLGGAPEIIGYGSTFPEYFANKGYKKSETLRAIDFALNGKGLTARQKVMVEDILQAKRRENTDKLMKLRAQPSEVDAAGLEEGDTLKRNGEVFKVTDVNEDGKVTLKDGEVLSLWGGEKIDYDRGTLRTPEGRMKRQDQTERAETAFRAGEGITTTETVPQHHDMTGTVEAREDQSFKQPGETAENMGGFEEAPPASNVRERRQGAQPGKSPAVDVSFNKEKGEIELRFTGHPGKEITERLNNMRFKPDESGNVWAAKDSPVRRQFAERLKAKLTAAKQTIGNERGEIVLRQGKEQGAGKHFEFSDENVEEGIQRNRKGIRGKSLISNLSEAALDFAHGFTRQFKTLPRNTFFAEANKVFADLEASRGTASREAQRKIINIMGSMDEAAADTFTKAVIINDALETHEIVKERGETFHYPFGINEENIDQLKAEVDTALDRLPEVQEAVDRYYQTTKELNKRYTEAADALGVHGTENRFKRDKYFHHMVMRYADASKGTQGANLKTKLFRNFMRKRYGSVEDINTNVVQATFKVYAQMEADIRRMELYKELKDSYDLMPQLKKQLRVMRHNIMRGLAARVGFMDESLPDKVKRLWEIGKEKAEIMSGQDFRESRIIRLDHEFHKVSREIQRGIDTYREKLLDPGFYEKEYARFKEGWEEKKEADFPEDVGDTLFAIGTRPLTEFQFALLNGDIKPFIKPLLKKAAGGREYRLATVQDHFYRAKSVADDMVDELMLDVAGEVIGKNDLKEILVKADPDVWVLPAEVVDTFDHIKNQAITARTKGKRFIHIIGSGMKRWWLFAPHNVIRYISNNTVGDTSFLFGVAPKAAVGRYLKESLHVLLKMKNLEPLNVSEQRKADIAFFFRKGGEEVGITVQETPRAQSHKMLKAFQQRGWLDRIADLPADYLDSVYAINTFTETSRRLAAYLYFLDKWRDGETAYGASNRELIDGLLKIEDKSYQVANDALVNYAQTSESGRNLADWFLFWSYREGNFRRWYNLFRNIPVDEGRARAILKASGMLAGKSVAKLTGVAVVRGAQTIVMLSLLQALTNAFNWLLWPDEENEMADEVRSKPHLIFGRDDNGNVLYWQTYDAMTELLSWVGLDQWVKQFKGIDEGKGKDVVLDVMFAPVNQVYGLWNPLLGKYAMEMLMGKTGWPKIQEARPVRDEAEYFAGIFGLVPEYQLITGKPTKGYLRDRGKSLLINRADTGQSAYFKTNEMVEDFLDSKNRGKFYGEPQGENAKSKRDALYNLKRAIQFHDYEAQQKYTRLYRKYGGTFQGLRQSVRVAHPLAAIPEALQAEFRNGLTLSQQKTVDRAMEWYEQVYGGNVTATDFNE
jgi:hypothetical protein